jgi:hypothetical protein
MKVRELVGQLHVGGGSQVGAVTWFPVWTHRGAPARTSFIPREGRLSIRELPEPRVERLIVTNSGVAPALLVQGLSLRGGSQDRTCVATLLVAPKTTMEVPVACIERGRWSDSSHALHVADSVTPRVRARNAAAGQRCDQATSDQAGTWLEVDALFATHGRRSATDSYHDLRRELRQPAAPPVRPLEGQRGVVIGYGGMIRAVELFGSSRDLARMLRLTLGAAQVEAAGVAPAPVTASRARRAVAAVGRLEVTATPSLGWGEDLRGAQDGFTATGLRRDGSLLHLAAFRDELALAS